ncbi:hypothetical protein [Pseudomonas prosekii]|uniref:hypothetical protein n=1 Tax=Pseudomonas prosekii TaxID=1148509 RepID=UPI0011B2549B|nr:hypothetical protein [Pseudomonas prosekii]
MKKLARSIAIFLITTYIDTVYRYAASLHPSVGAELAREGGITFTINGDDDDLFASKLRSYRAGQRVIGRAGS